MRTLALLLAFCACALLGSPARAQVTDAERAAARDLFKQGDELQRQSKFAEALDKFQRAQQVFSAPTNMLRIAECQASLGRLVESTESYRAVVRTPLPAGAPPAFQSAVDQAKGELTQVEPRVPKLTVQVEPAGLSGVQLQIDGQNVPAALVGESIPLNPGPHKVIVFASGYVSTEQTVILAEREAKTASLTLKPIGSIAYTQSTSPPPVGTTSAIQPGATSPETPRPNAPPPPPPPAPAAPAQAPVERSRMGVIVGAHLGWELPAGTIPLSSATLSETDLSNVSGGGLALGFDGGFRFGRQWYVGVTLEHAWLGKGKDLSQLGDGTVTDVSSDTTLLGLVLAIIVNPDRASFYFELGLGNRWYNFTQVNGNGSTTESHYPALEGLLGLGLWIPAGRSVRLLPEIKVGLGTFSAPGQDAAAPSTNPGHAFLMLGIGGFYNLDL